jgi:hypothetical protein
MYNGKGGEPYNSLKRISKGPLFPVLFNIVIFATVVIEEGGSSIFLILGISPNGAW